MRLVECSPCYREKYDMIINIGSRIRFLGFKCIYYYFIAMCSQASYLLTLGVSFLNYKRVITIVAISRFIIRISS